MTDTLRHVAMSAENINSRDQSARFLRWLHSDQAGYAEIVAGQSNPNDPKKIDLVMSTRRWLYLDPERPDLYDQASAYIGQLSASYGNVYTGIRLYTKQAKDENTRKEAYTRPGRVIFIDDAPAAPEIPYSASIRTSEHSRHAYYKCDRPVTKDDARRAAAALGGDASGVDLTQLVRIPGTVNTKHNQRWAVGKESAPGIIYSLDQLRSAWPAVECSPKGEITALDVPLVEQHLANIDALLASGRAGCIKSETQSGRILAGERIMIASAKLGRMDDSDSAQAAILASGFYRRGFMDEEITAVVFHHYQKWGVEARKGTAWCIADIQRCIANAKAKKPGVVQSPTRYRQQAAGITIVSRPAASRARADRPTKFDPAMLFARYQAEPALCDQRRKARAAGLGISTATLDRLENNLRALGLVEIDAKPGMPGRVILLGGVINIPSPEVLSGPIEAPTPKAPIARTESGENADRAPQCIGETHPPPEAPSPPAAPPATLQIGIRRAIRAIEQDSLDPDTGEVHKLGRATPDRVRAWLSTAYPGMDTTDVETVYPEVRKALQARRTQDRNKAFWDTERAKARALDNEPLLAALIGCASRMQAAERKRPGSPWSKRCAAIFGIYDDERRRRGLSVTEAAPAPARDFNSRKAARARVAKVAEVLNQPEHRPEHIDPAQLGFANVVEDTVWLQPSETSHAKPVNVARWSQPAGQGDRGRVCPPQPSAPAGATPAQLMAERRRRREAQQAQP